MKGLALLPPAFALVVITATAALAHVDSLGQPDPYWQQISAAAVTGAPATPENATPFEGFLSFGGLSLLLLGFGAAFALDIATAPANFWGARWVEHPPSLAERTAAESADAAAHRTVELLPPSASGELRHVLRAAGAIVLSVLLLSALHANGRGAPAAPLAAAPTRLEDLPPGVQDMIRQVQTGLIAVEDLRASTARWPRVEALAAQGAPPFQRADSPYAWRLIEENAYAAYVGTPTPDSHAPALLALVQESPPGADAAAAATPGAENRPRLADGTTLRVSVWFRDDGLAPDDRAISAALREPSSAGWKPILAAR